MVNLTGDGVQTTSSRPKLSPMQQKKRIAHREYKNPTVGAFDCLTQNIVTVLYTVLSKR